MSIYVDVIDSMRSTISSTEFSLPNFPEFSNEQIPVGPRPQNGGHGKPSRTARWFSKVARLSRLALTNMGTAVSLYVKSGIASGTAAPVPCRHRPDRDSSNKKQNRTPKNDAGLGLGVVFGCHLFFGYFPITIQV